MSEEFAGARVVAVCAAPGHGFSKPTQMAITLLAGLGVEGDSHAGVTVKHRSRVRADPTQPNLRQVHFITGELLGELDAIKPGIGPGALGENVTTEGLDILALPTGTVLRLGETARVEITGLRNPCSQIEAFGQGLLAATLDKGPDGEIIRKAGIMGIVLEGGEVRPGDAIVVTLPPLPHRRLEKV